MNVLIVAAHPDDVEILCGGTAAKYARLGHKVTYCILTDGQISSQKIPNDELIAIRRREAEAAANVVGAQVIHFRIKDGMLMDNESNRLQVLEAILKVRPDILITHSEKDYAPDHRVAQALVLAVVPMSVLANCYSDLPCLQMHPKVCLMDTVAGVEFLPTEYVDISEDFETKVRALHCHKSQMQAFEDLGYDIDEAVRAQSRFRGMQAGVTYAEGFQKLHNWYSGVTTRILP